MKTTCEKPTVMYEVIGRKTPNGKMLILHKLPPAGVQFRIFERVCGNCIGCKIKRRMDLSLRLQHESNYHDDSLFVTLTYHDDHLPYAGSLKAEHISEFMKALRKKYPKSKIRFFGVGEYGEQSLRPHYHVIIFNLSLSDRKLMYTKPFKNLYSKALAEFIHATPDLKYYSSETLTNLWKKGNVQFSDVSPATMEYVAKYHIQKITGDDAREHYSRSVIGFDVVDWCDAEFIVQVEPETARMSRNPGLGRSWIEEFWPDVYPDGAITTIVDGKKVIFSPPKYYDKWLEQNHPEMYQAVKAKRRDNLGLELEISKRREDIATCRKAQMNIYKTDNEL